MNIKSLKKFSSERKFLNVSSDFWIIVSLFLLFSTLYSLLSVIRHNHFQSQAFDFSIYDQALWLYSRGNIAYLTLLDKLDLADRFRPIMLPLSSLYWFTENERVLLIFQSVILAAAIFPIWLLAGRLLPRVLAVLIAFIYVDFIGIQATAAYDFHEMAILPFFLAWLFYFLEKEKWLEYFVTLVISLAVREHVGIILATLGIYVYFRKQNLKVALFTFLISTFWSLTAIFLIMPKLGQEYYQSFVSQGDTFGEASLGYLSDPAAIFKNFFWPLEKTQTLFWSFFSFGLIGLSYLPLLSTILLQFASRFLDLQHPIRWTLYYHYSAELAVLLAVSTIYGSKQILKKIGKNAPTFLVLTLLTLHLTTNAVLHSPLKNLLKPQFRRQENWMNETKLILSMVPKDVPVAAQNNLLPHLSHRQQIYLLPLHRDAKYIVVDLHPGQNDWNFYTDNLKKAKVQFKELILSDQYQPIYSSGDAYLLERPD